MNRTYACWSSCYAARTAGMDPLQHRRARDPSASDRATSRMNAAYLLEALPDNTIRDRASNGMRRGWRRVKVTIAQAVNDGTIAHDRDADIETDRMLALTGLTPLLDLKTINPGGALAATD